MKQQGSGVDIVMLVVTMPLIMVVNVLVGLVDGFRSGMTDCRLMWNHVNKKSTQPE